MTNPFDPRPGDDDGNRETFPMTTTTSTPITPSGRFGQRDTTSSHTNAGFESEDTNDQTPLIRRENKVEEAMARIKNKFPEWDTTNTTFLADIDDLDRVTVKIKKLGSKKHVLFKPDGTLNEKVPKTITDSLGPTAEEIVAANQRRIGVLNEEIDELQSRQANSSGPAREAFSRAIAAKEDEIQTLEHANEVSEERISLRERVKTIFKKYGLSALAITAAVGTVIGAVVRNLKSGLSKVAKGVGNGLKEIGKKLGEILPGIIGAIANFVFKTAGEVVGFLAENTWLLIVGAVIFAVEQLKRKNKSNKR